MASPSTTTAGSFIPYPNRRTDLNHPSDSYICREEKLDCRTSGRNSRINISNRGGRRRCRQHVVVSSEYIKRRKALDSSCICPGTIPKRRIIEENAVRYGRVNNSKSCKNRRIDEKFPPEGKFELKFTHSSVSLGVALVSLLKDSANQEDVRKGRSIHTDIVTKGLLEDNVYIGSALIHMYAKCGSLTEAQEVFDKLLVRDVVTWNTLIAGYVQHGYGERSLNCFAQMQGERVSPTSVTFVCVLKAIGFLGISEKGQEMHLEIVKLGLLQNDMFLSSALLDMYCKCGEIVKAQEVFDALCFRDVVSWTSLISGYADHENGEEALYYFGKMQSEGICPNIVTFACVLKACGCIGALIRGKEIHQEIHRKGLLGKDVTIDTALVDMYAKCGDITTAREVFNELCVQDVISWTVLIAGYAQLGEEKAVFRLFSSMIREGVKPNVVTFSSILNSCSHSGLLEECQAYFDIMSVIYDITPTLEHYTCMIDLYGRTGHLENAVSVLKDMPFSADRTLWHTFMGASQKWGNMKVGKLAFDHLMHINKDDVVAYISMSNIYMTSGMEEDVDMVQAIDFQM